MSLLSRHRSEIEAFHAGRGWDAWRLFGAQPVREGGRDGYRFLLWAPRARQVLLIGNFGPDAWWPERVMVRDGDIWAWFEPDCKPGALYKYRVVGADGTTEDKADPFSAYTEPDGRNASVALAKSRHRWRDGDWLAARGRRQARDQPLSMYEVHFGSWRHKDGRSLSYREMAAPLIEHVHRMGFTHVEFLPLAEHPYYPSWGYQVTGYFAPTSRYGTPDDLRWLVDQLHLADIGVLVDWVPAHFPDDPHSLANFDGLPLYEDPNPKRGRHPEWGTSIFDFGRPEVKSFLLASAACWLESFHFDGLRVDAVASMLYLDYSRAAGQWEPNIHGGNHNLEAIAFIRDLNELVSERGNGAITIAEESTAFAKVTEPKSAGGLGFAYKWNMGWMHDTLKYFKGDPMFRVHHHDTITFSTLYLNDEAFVLPLSHDEVVHLKAPLVRKMGGWWEHGLTQLRLLFGYQWTHPGKKLLFMGCEFGQDSEWSYDHELPWAQAAQPGRQGLMLWLADLNALYRSHPAMHQGDCHAGGFRWVEGSDAERSILVWERVADDGRSIVVVLHFTPVVLPQHWLPLPGTGKWRILLWSDLQRYGGFMATAPESVEAVDTGGRPMARLDVPGYAVIVLERVGDRS